MPKYIELSHEIESGMITYRGLPPPIVSAHMTREESRSHYAEGTEFHIAQIQMVANTGTYLDAPFHRYADGADLSQLSLSSLVNLTGIRISTLQSNRRAIDRSFFENLDLQHKAVLIHTGWDKHWRTEQYFDNHPFLTLDAVEYLAKSGPSLVGIDSLNIDDTADGSRPAHSLLLRSGIPVVEHLCNLQLLPDQGFSFFAVPPMFRGVGTFPVRAFAVVYT